MDLDVYAKGCGEGVVIRSAQHFDLVRAKPLIFSRNPWKQRQDHTCIVYFSEERHSENGLSFMNQ
jgi:hypothetical protein